MTLTDRERKLVQDTWKCATVDIHATGIELFIRLFKENPSYLNYFKFGDIENIDDLRTRPRLKAHARNVMNTLNMIITSLDEPEIVEEMVGNIGESHKKRKLGEEQFQRLKLTIVGLLSDALGKDIMNDETVNAWAKFYQIFLDKMRA